MTTRCDSVLPVYNDGLAHDEDELVMTIHLIKCSHLIVPVKAAGGLEHSTPKMTGEGHRKSGIRLIPPASCPSLAATVILLNVSSRRWPDLSSVMQKCQRLTTSLVFTLEDDRVKLIFQGREKKIESQSEMSSRTQLETSPFNPFTAHV